MIQFVLKNSHKRTNENIHVIAADGFINQDCVTNKFGLPHATYMCDTWHLFDSILPKRFGIDTFGQIKPYLQSMCYSKTESQFDEAFTKAMSVLQDKPFRDENLEEQLRKFYNERTTYASHILSKKRGTRGCHGSSISESNHSSVLVHLNEGDKFGNSYCEKPHTLVKDLFFRQKKHINHWNSVLYNESIQLDVLRGKINKQYEPSLHEACSTLCLNTFKRFKCRMEEAKNYVKQVLSLNCVCIKSLRHPDAPARLCHRKSLNHPFTCKTCEITIAYEEQCVHSVVANDMKYINEQFDFRHYRRVFVSSDYKTQQRLEDDDNNNSVREENQNLKDVEKFGNDYLSLDEASQNYINSDTNDDQDTDDEIFWEADNIFNCNEKEASYYEQECQQRGKIKAMNASELRKTFNLILSNYDTCTEQMKMVVNSIALSLNDITQTDGKSSGIFCQVDRNDVDNEYASKQIVNIIKKHNNSFLPTKGAFKKRSNNLNGRKEKVTERTQTQLRKQKRLRITSNKEKYLKRNGKRNLECVLMPDVQINHNQAAPCFVNRKSVSSCGFCGSNTIGENISNCNKRSKYKREYCEYIVSKTDEGIKHLIGRLQHDLPLSTKEYPSNIVSMSAGCNRGKHIVISNVWMKRQINPTHRVLPNMILEIHYIDKQGDIESLKRTICGEEFESMIHVMKYRNKKTFIYDATKNEINLSQQHASFTQNSTYSMNSLITISIKI